MDTLAFTINQSTYLIFYIDDQDHVHFRDVHTKAEYSTSIKKLLKKIYEKSGQWVSPSPYL